MSDWEVILNEADWLAQQLRQRQVDLAEAEKVGDYFVSKKYDETALLQFLDLMAKRPPPRSRRSQPYFQNLHAIWQTWRSRLTGPDKARAWGWGVRVAKSMRNH